MNKKEFYYPQSLRENWKDLNSESIRLSILIFLQIGKKRIPRQRGLRRSVKLKIDVNMLLGASNLEKKKGLLLRMKEQLWEVTDYISGRKYFFIDSLCLQEKEILVVVISKNFFMNVSRIRWGLLSIQHILQLRLKKDYLMYSVLVNLFNRDGAFSSNFSTNNKPKSYLCRIMLDDLKIELGLENKYKERNNNFILKVIKPLRKRFDTYSFTFDFSVVYINNRMFSIDILLFLPNPWKLENINLFEGLTRSEIKELFVLKGTETELIEFYSSYNYNYPYNNNYNYNVDAPYFYFGKYQIHKRARKSNKNKEKLNNPFFKSIRYKKLMEGLDIKPDTKVRYYVDIEIFNNSHMFDETQEEYYTADSETYFNQDYIVHQELDSYYSIRKYYDGHNTELLNWIRHDYLKVV